MSPDVVGSPGSDPPRSSVLAFPALDESLLRQLLERIAVHVEAGTVVWKSIPEMVAEADRLKQQYQNERTAWILASEQRRLADDSEAYEKLLDRVQMHLSKYRINDALESFAGHQDKLETRLYQELYDGYAADLKQLKMLFEDRRDVFGQKIPYQLPPKLAALHKGYASNGHIVSLLSSRGSWKFGFRTKYGQFSATTTVGLALAEFPRNTILDWLAGDSQKPSHRIVAASIAAANIFGQFRWARRQIAVLEIRVATRGADSDLLSHAKKHRQAIEQHVAREWQRTVKARDIRKTYLAVPLPERKLSNEERRIVAEALVVSERLRKRYLEIFGYRQEVRADCRDWLRAKVNDSNKIKAISSFRSIRSLSQLQAKLKTIGITSPLTSKQRKKKGDQFLEYKGIALRMNETPMSEKEVVGEFIEAAKEMSR